MEKQIVNGQVMIFDLMGELTESFYRAGAPDGSIDWAGITTGKSAVEAASEIIPEPTASEDTFWNTAARAVLEGILIALVRDGKCNEEELVKAITAPIVEIAAVCNSLTNKNGYSYIQDADSKQADCVIRVLWSFVSPLIEDESYQCERTAAMEEAEAEVRNLQAKYADLYAKAVKKGILPELAEQETLVAKLPDTETAEQFAERFQA